MIDFLTAVSILGVATAGVAVESEILVHSVEAVTTTLGLDGGIANGQAAAAASSALPHSGI